MKTEKVKTPKRHLTDSDRDAILRLTGCGLSAKEISDTMRIGLSTVHNVRQSHKACVKKDWSTLQKLSTICRATVDWAMKVTGADKEFEELFKEPEQTVAETTAPAPVAESITREEFLSLSNTLQDICYLLTEIRDLLK